VYITGELFSLLLRRCFKKSQKHHQGPQGWESKDELTDVDSRHVADVIVGTHFADHPGDIFLLHSEVLDKVNHTTIAVLSIP
jgi:hypothetical protein